MLSKKALKLIFDYEGFDQPSHWPGGQSGVTLGIGYDLGHVTEKQFRDDWEKYLPDDQVEQLVKCIGLTGSKAKAVAPSLKNVTVKRADAEQVFLLRSAPLYEQRTLQAFPGVEALPLDAYGALVSLVFNRGPSMTGDSRKEMRFVRAAVARKDLKEIATQIRSMKRIWVGKGLDGLIKRREAEALLVESCIK